VTGNAAIGEKIRWVRENHVEESVRIAFSQHVEHFQGIALVQPDPCASSLNTFFSGLMAEGGVVPAGDFARGRGGRVGIFRRRSRHGGSFDADDGMQGCLFDNRRPLANAAGDSDMSLPATPRLLTTVVGSYPVPDWLVALPSEQALVDATSVVFKLQELAGIDVVADGELYRFDINHPDTNGMIDYFVRPLGGVRGQIGLADLDDFARMGGMKFRAKPAGVVEGPVTAGALDLVTPCQRARSLTRSPLKFTVTGPHMLSRTLLDRHYRQPPELALALARVLALQVARLEADVVQIDEANIPGHPEDSEWAAAAINVVLDATRATSAVHLCFGNYGGQTIQKGTWTRLIGFLNALHADHFVLEMSRRSEDELAALRELDARFGIGLGVIDIKSTVVETPDEVARRIERAEKILGAGRVRYVHPDCGFWMLKRSVVDRKMQALVTGRNEYLGLQ
jgi:5-methyltetrahydropteroyltriglutamate--homocysteine methyltransferase